MVESASDVDEQRMKACSLRALVPTIIGIVMWNVIGVMNMESSLHIEYSLGSSSPWHSFWHRGDPGEVVRHWWVPIYDQWSGLGYRLPTQGLLTDTPLAYLALILPINGIRTLVWFGSLWFMFSQVHRWIASWVKTYQIFVCVFVDLLFLGLLSFYSLLLWETISKTGNHFWRYINCLQFAEFGEILIPRTVTCTNQQYARTRLALCSGRANQPKPSNEPTFSSRCLPPIVA